MFSVDKKKSKTSKKNEDRDRIMRDVEDLEEALDTEGQDFMAESEWMEGVEVQESAVDLPEDERAAKKQEERFFTEFFGRKEPMTEASKEEIEDMTEELRRKLGANAAISAEEEERIKAMEEGEDYSGGGREKEVGGFEARGRRGASEDGASKKKQKKTLAEREAEEWLQLERNEKRARDKAREIRVDDEDRLMVGNVVVPSKWEKWVLEPEADHRRRHGRLRVQEERRKLWMEQNGGKNVRVKGEARTRWRIEDNNDNNDDAGNHDQDAEMQMGGKSEFESQGLTIRQKRVGRAVEGALEAVFKSELEHLSVPLGLSVERVWIHRDMRSAKVAWSCSMSGEKEEVLKKHVAEAGKWLQRMKPVIRYAVTQRVQLKFSPQLEFVRVDYVNRQAEIARMMQDIDTEWISTAEQKV